MCLSLLGCSEENQNTNDTSPEQDIKEFVIGTWERTFYTSDRKCVRQEIEVYQGGTGKFWIYSDGDKGFYTATWEIKDGVLNFTYYNIPLGLILDTEAVPMTLTRVDDSTAIFTKVSEE